VQTNVVFIQGCQHGSSNPATFKEECRFCLATASLLQANRNPDKGGRIVFTVWVALNAWAASLYSGVSAIPPADATLHSHPPTRLAFDSRKETRNSQRDIRNGVRQCQCGQGSTFLQVYWTGCSTFPCGAPHPPDGCSRGPTTLGRSPLRT